MADRPITFGVRDCKIATWLGNKTYGTLVDVYGIRQLSVEETVNTQALEGDDKQLAVATKTTGANITIARCSVDFPATEVMTGKSAQSSTGGYGKYLSRTNSQNKYFGILGIVDQIDGEEVSGSGEVVFFAPKVKVNAGLQFAFNNNEFTIPQTTLAAVFDTYFKDYQNEDVLWQIFTRDTKPTITMPPTP